MVGVRFQGRLGNQMFQYAFVVALAEELNTVFYLDDSKQKNCLTRVFKLRRSTPNTLKTDFTFYFRLIESLIKRKPFETFLNDYAKIKFRKELSAYPIIQQSGDEIPNVWRNKITDDALYEGFFQCSEYLPPFNVVSQYFDIKPLYLRKFEKKYKNIFDNFKTIVVHIRRTDYINWGSEELGGENLILPMRYYLECINNIENVDQYKTFFISDDINFVKEYFGLRENFFFETNEEIIDLQLLINADIMVLANSSFSWWGAFLGTKKNKIVYVPKYWLGFKVKKEYPVGIIEKFWRQIEIRDV